MDEKLSKVGIGVMIFREAEILLSKRRGSPGHGDGDYAFPGGHLEYMESFEDCARCETTEECGMEIENIRFVCVGNMQRFPPRHYVHIGMVADWKNGEPRVLEPDRTEAWNWYALNELPHPIFEPTRMAIECYKDGKNYYGVVR